MTANIDWDHISNLLNIAEKTAGHSGKLNSIANAAMQELLEANESVRQHAITKRMESDKEAQAEASKENQRLAKEQEDRLNAERKNEAQGRVPPRTGLLPPLDNEVADDQEQIHDTGDGSQDDLPELGTRPIVRRPIPETPNGRRV